MCFASGAWDTASQEEQRAWGIPQRGFEVKSMLDWGASSQKEENGRADGVNNDSVKGCFVLYHQKECIP